jgi:hypothetical protein
MIRALNLALVACLLMTFVPVASAALEDPPRCSGNPGDPAHDACQTAEERAWPFVVLAFENVIFPVYDAGYCALNGVAPSIFTAGCPPGH